MDVTPLPAATLPPAALAMRGPDHDLVYGVANDFCVTHHEAVAGRQGAVANERLAPYSRVAGSLVQGLFTRDPAVLAHMAHGGVIGPARLRTHHAQLMADGLALIGYTESEWIAAREYHYESMDLSNIPAAHLVVIADFVGTQPHVVQGGAAGAARAAPTLGLVPVAADHGTRG